jgi:cupin 2 domain-containing protein
MSALPRGNLLAPLPPAGTAEHVAALLARPGLRIERIVSHGQASPPDFWYDQAEDEWVLLLAGSATLALDDGTRVDLGPGDWLTLPAHCRHRVERTASPTVWLAVFAGGG